MAFLCSAEYCNQRCSDDVFVNQALNAVFFAWIASLTSWFHQAVLFSLPICCKHLLFLLVLESPCLPITLFHVLLSLFICVLKSPSKTIDSVYVTFCKATPTSSKKGWYCASVLSMIGQTCFLNGLLPFRLLI